MTCCLIAELIRIEEDVSLVHEKEEVLVRIETLRDQDIADFWEGIICDSDLDLIMILDVLDYFRLSVHFIMDSK